MIRDELKDCLFDAGANLVGFADLVDIAIEEQVSSAFECFMIGMVDYYVGASIKLTILDQIG